MCVILFVYNFIFYSNLITVFIFGGANVIQDAFYRVIATLAAADKQFFGAKLFLPFLFSLVHVDDISNLKKRENYRGFPHIFLFPQDYGEC